MKLLLICLFLTFCTCRTSKAIREVKTFEFGQNNGFVVFTATGSFSQNEKLKKVLVEVAECLEVTYVRVDFSIDGNPPYVEFFWDNYIVLMDFNLDQYSVSDYNILAKAKWKEYCQSAAPQSAEQTELLSKIYKGKNLTLKESKKL